jgi:hypothetical protein
LITALITDKNEEEHSIVELFFPRINQLITEDSHKHYNYLQRKLKQKLFMKVIQDVKQLGLGREI